MTVQKDILAQISMAEMVLNELKRENKNLAQKDDPNQILSVKKMIEKDTQSTDQMDVDIDSLLEDMRVEITRIHEICRDPDANQQKQPIVILQEIEVKLNEYMRDIKQFHDTGTEHAKLVCKEVDIRKE